MLLGVISAMLMLGAGFAGVRIVGVARGPIGLGLAPAVGIALLAVLTTWTALLRLPQVVTGAAILGLCLIGLALAARDSIPSAPRWRCYRLELGTVLAALCTTLLVLAQGVSIQAGVPDYVHDGAFHAEFIDALRHGNPLAGYEWYPSGFHAPAAALLSLLPGIDSASGAVGWAVGLTIIAPLATFGLCLALWRDARVAAVGALLLAITYNFPYEPHLYSVWPNAAGLVVVVGLWTIALEYLAHPGPRLAMLGGLLTCGLALTHGTELYTAAIVLMVVAISCWRAVTSRGVGRDIALAAATTVVLAAPYLRDVRGWASTGGAVAVGLSYFDVRHGGPLTDPLQEALFWSSAISSGLLFDLPVRLGLLSVGAWLAFRHRHGRLLVALTLAFAALVALFRYFDTDLVRELFALTLPWGVDGRLLMTVPLVSTPLSALGLVCLAEVRVRRARRAGSGEKVNDLLRRQAALALVRRQAVRAALLLGIASGLASPLLVAEKFVLQTSGIVTYTPGDAAAFAWLRQHAQPGEVLMNDGAADAGIWAPYKANVSIVLPRARSVAPDGPELLVRANVGRLDTRSDVREAACRLRIRYVYHGGSSSPSEHRQFPSLEELRASPGLEEIFSSGEAAIFRTRLSCV